ncbi:hypothetical protein [Methylobacterium gnaphalii]|uniref:Uncharacterized protein n=1 Tax=Methylobacterium gnaphalii TaxID=1010610 RepID=A0A512JPG3_9HYPH|nr:hypothetical protein [Methylobacterium gnaphalii]GEP11837.1 hypothetical protein MGN01_36820 [Methylobacterium gnaphalii]GJD69421.1 hypothetical protein MMMDOFMJ_2352 [Methylobacterium gnaphalii]GLS49623.1 hypothetical protein GCM10007885_24720 [Methylobacterium gnaphalii]
MASARLALRAALACLVLSIEPARAQARRPVPALVHRPPPAPPFVPTAALSSLRLGSSVPRQLLLLDRCPGACTWELNDFALVRVTISVGF